MRARKVAIFACAWLLPLVTSAASTLVVLPEIEQIIENSDVVIIGETHDNSSHHDKQAAIVSRVGPKAVVWEMLDKEAADALRSQAIMDQGRTDAIIGWSASGWPSFDMYFPIFEAAGDAVHYGANVSRDASMQALQSGPRQVLGDGNAADQLGLTKPLPADEQATREAAQLAAHCDALPVEWLPRMVQIQRLRDAKLAQATLTALGETGGPVVVITGNGHARRDWGMSRYIQFVAPDVAIFTIGQSENGALAGTFDWIIDSPAPERSDPCDAFKKQ